MFLKRSKDVRERESEALCLLWYNMGVGVQKSTSPGAHHRVVTPVLLRLNV